MVDVSPIDPDPENIEVARVRRLAEARELALVLMAQGIPYMIERSGDEWVLLADSGKKRMRFGSWMGTGGKC